MDAFIRLFIICVIGAVLAVFVKKSSPDMGLMVTLAVCAVVLTALLAPLRDVVDLLRQMMDWSGMGLDEDFLRSMADKITAAQANSALNKI